MESLTACAGHARTYDPVHDKASRDIFQLLGDIFAKRLEVAAAFPTGIPWRQDRLIAWEMTGQWFTLGFALWRRCRLTGIGWRGFLRGRGNLFVFQRQRQLVQGLGPRSEPMLAHPGQLVFELLDQDVAELQLRRQRGHKTLQGGGVVREVPRVKHEDKLWRCRA